MSVCIIDAISLKITLLFPFKISLFKKYFSVLYVFVMMLAFLKCFLMLGCPLVVYCKRLFACLWMLVTIRGIYLAGEKTQTCLWWAFVMPGESMAT